MPKKTEAVLQIYSTGPEVVGFMVKATSKRQRRHIYSMDRRLWEAMDKPEYIRIAVEATDG